MRTEKQLGFWMCTALVVGNTIGVGIFVLPASLAPFGLNAMLGWCVTALGMVAIARVFARLARRYPDADGPFAYIEATTGRPAAFFATWCYWVNCWITNAAIATGAVAYLGTLTPALGTMPPSLLALAMVWICIAINVLGVRAGGGVQVVTTVLKLMPLVAIVVLGAWQLAVAPAAYVEHVPPTPLSLGAVMAASTIALYAMLGMESGAVPAGRVKDPARTIPLATTVGTLLTAGIYVIVSSVALLLVPQSELGAANAPFVNVLDRLAGAGFGGVLAVFVGISGFGALNGWTLLVSELTASMARHGTLPRVLERTNANGAPVVALLVTGVLASLTLLMNYTRSLVDGFTFLTQVVTAASLPLYFFCALALLVGRARGPAAGAPAMPREMPVIGVLGLAYTVFAFIGVGRDPFLWALALGAAGLPFYFYMRRRSAPRAEAVSHANP